MTSVLLMVGVSWVSPLPTRLVIIHAFLHLLTLYFVLCIFVFVFVLA